MGLLMLKRASCILVVQYRDGERQWVCADRASWKYCVGGPYLELGYQDPVQRGKVERYDARLNPEGWNKNGFDDRAWMGGKLCRPFRSFGYIRRHLFSVLRIGAEPVE